MKRKDRDHQFGMEVLGRHVCSFWAASYHRPATDPSSVWFENAAGHTVMALTLFPGLTVEERMSDDYMKEGEWQRIIDGLTVQSLANQQEPNPSAQGGQ